MGKKMVRGGGARINSLISEKHCCMTGGLLKETRNENAQSIFD